MRKRNQIPLDPKLLTNNLWRINSWLMLDGSHDLLRCSQPCVFCSWIWEHFKRADKDSSGNLSFKVSQFPRQVLAAAAG